MVVSEYNGCAYCLAAHTTVAKLHGFTEAQTISIRNGNASSNKDQALINFTRAVLEQKGHIADKDLKALWKADYDYRVTVEVIGQIANNIFNNYMNTVAETEIDFLVASNV